MPISAILGCPPPAGTAPAANRVSTPPFPAMWPIAANVCANSASAWYGCGTQRDAAAQYRQNRLRKSNPVPRRAGAAPNRSRPAACESNRPYWTNAPIILSLSTCFDLCHRAACSPIRQFLPARFLFHRIFPLQRLRMRQAAGDNPHFHHAAHPRITCSLPFLVRPPPFGGMVADAAIQAAIRTPNQINTPLHPPSPAHAPLKRAILRDCLIFFRFFAVFCKCRLTPPQ